MSSEEGYTVHCPECDAPYYFTGFDVDVDEKGNISVILLAVCSELCDGGVEVNRFILSKNFLKDLVRHQREEEQFVQMMKAEDFRGPESADGG